MTNNTYEYEKSVAQALDVLLDSLKTHEVVIAYKKISDKVATNDSLNLLVEDIKKHQKAAVEFEHYDKFNAQKEELRLADQKQKELDMHPLVVEYRACLAEADELLQYVTKTLQVAVNNQLEEKCDKKNKRE